MKILIGEKRRVFDTSLDEKIHSYRKNIKAIPDKYHQKTLYYSHRYRCYYLYHASNVPEIFRCRRDEETWHDIEPIGHGDAKRFLKRHGIEKKGLTDKK